MAASAFGRAMVAAGGTMFVLGAATVAVSTVGVSVARVVIQNKKSKTAVACTTCSGRKKIECDVCRGMAIGEGKAKTAGLLTR